MCRLEDMTDFNSPQYKRVLRANNRRNDISGKVNTKWTPLDADECVHTQLHKAQDHLIDFKKDSEYKKLYKQQSELIENWVKKEEKRFPPSPPMSPFS